MRTSLSARILHGCASLTLPACMAAMSGSVLAQTAPDPLVYPTLTSESASGDPGSEVGFDGTGGYSFDASGAPDYSPRSFRLYFDGEQAGDMECSDDVCTGTARFPDDATPGTHHVSVDGGSRIEVAVTEPLVIEADPVPRPLSSQPFTALPGLPPLVPDLPLSLLKAKIVETDVIKLAGSSDTPPTYVTAAGTGQQFRLTTWKANGPGQSPMDTLALTGFDVKLFQTVIGSQRIVVSASRRTVPLLGNLLDGLWLNSWRVEANGSLTLLKTSSFLQPGVPVLAYAIAGRTLDGQFAELFIPFVTSDNLVRVQTWQVGANGALLSKSIAETGGIARAASPGLQVARQQGNEYVVNYAISSGNIAWEYWSVATSGVPSRLQAVVNRRNIDGTAVAASSAQSDFAALPFTPVGQVIADFAPTRAGGPVAISTFDHSRTAGTPVVYGRPRLIASNFNDQSPQAPGVDIPGPTGLLSSDGVPTMAVSDGLYEEALGEGGGLLYGSNAYEGPTPAAGIGSVTKAMTVHLAIRAANAGLLSLDECVTLGGGGPLQTDEPLSPSEFGGNDLSQSYSVSSGRRNKLIPGPGGTQSVSLAPGDRLSLRTLLHMSMMISDAFAVRSVARFVAQRMVDAEFAANDPAKPDTFLELVGASYSKGYFVQKMQDRSDEMGLGFTTLFCDPAGRCHSTPQDVMTFWRIASQDPDFVAVAAKTTFTAAEVVAEAAACGTTLSSGMTKGGFTGTAYPGFNGAKDGGYGNNLGVDYVGFGLQCYQQPPKTDRACNNCLAGMTVRLGRPLYHAQTRVPSTGNLQSNLYTLLNFGFRKIFTPDHLDDAPAGAVGDFALAGLGAGLAVSSGVKSDGKLEVCLWSAFDSVQKEQCVSRGYVQMLNGPTPPITAIDVADVTGAEADGDFLTGYRESGQLTLDLWRVGRHPN